MVAILAPLLGWIVRGAGHDTVGGIVELVSWFYGSVLLAQVLFMGHCEARDLDLSFPKRLFRFPVRTSILLSVHMGYGVVAIALPFLTVLGYAAIFDSPFGYWRAFLILETTFITWQTLAWLSGARAVFYFLLPSLAGVVTYHYLAARFDLPTGTNILCPAIIVLCCGISVWNVCADRRGAWISGWRWVDSLFSLFLKSPGEGFGSALRAQSWFESRQTGYIYPIAILGLMVPLLGLRIMTLILFPETPPPALASYESMAETLFLPVAAAWMAGAVCIAVYDRGLTSGASDFCLRRPVSTWILAVARLKTMAHSVAGALAILMVITLALLTRDLVVGAQSGIQGFIPQALEDRSSLEIGTMAVLALLGYALVCWVYLELPGELFLVGLGLGLAWVIAWLYLDGDLVRIAEFLVSDFMRWSACVIAAGVTVGTLGSFHLACRRRLIDTAALVCIACVFPLVVISLGALSLWIGMIRGWPSLMAIIYILGAAAVPFIPLATVPLSMAELRHD